MRPLLRLPRLRRLARLDPVVLGMLSALGAAIAYGGGQAVAREVVTEYAPPLVATLFALLFGTLTLAVLTHRDIPQDVKAPGRAFLLMGLAGLSSSAGVWFLFIALHLEPVVVVSPVGSLSPLFALLFTHLFLQRLERVTLPIIAGTLLVILGVTLVIISGA